MYTSLSLFQCLYLPEDGEEDDERPDDREHDSGFRLEPALPACAREPGNGSRRDTGISAALAAS